MKAEDSCPSSVSWYCNFHSQHWTGCCSVNACQQTPIGCPEWAAWATSSGDVTTRPRTTTTVKVTLHTSKWTTTTITVEFPPDSTGDSLDTSHPVVTPFLPEPPLTTTSVELSMESDATSIALTTSTSSTGSTALAAPASSTALASDNGPNILIPVGALVRLVLGCAILLALGGIMACMKWGRHRHKKDKERHGDTELATDAAMEDSHGGSPNITGAKAQGQNVDQDRGNRDTWTTGIDTLQGDNTDGLISPASVSSAIAVASPTMSELDSRSIRSELDAVSAPRGRASELESVRSEPIQQLYHGQELRATLSTGGGATGPETYPNSWTRYGDVQV